jgi:hypothetical protein
LGFKICCTQGCGAFDWKKYVAWTSSEFFFVQLALKVKIVIANYDFYML